MVFGKEIGKIPSWILDKVAYKKGVFRVYLSYMTHFIWGWYLPTGFTIRNAMPVSFVPVSMPRWETNMPTNHKSIVHHSNTNPFHQSHSIDWIFYITLPIVFYTTKLIYISTSITFHHLKNIPLHQSLFTNHIVPHFNNCILYSNIYDVFISTNYPSAFMAKWAAIRKKYSADTAFTDFEIVTSKITSKSYFFHHGLNISSF